jgi:hypothetical protein
MSHLVVTEIRTTGHSRYRHGGSTVPLGIGSTRTFLLFASGLEINFSETADGRRARGLATFPGYYVARQVVIEEKSWHWIAAGGGTSGRWVAQPTQRNLPDDPDPALVQADGASRTLSFYDNPGVPIDYLAGLGGNVHRVCVLQNFRLWREVSRRSGGSGPRASDDVTWNHLLYLGRTSTGWKVTDGEFRKWTRTLHMPP